MACPFFVPTEILAGDVFQHRARLPLGEGYRGFCGAGDEPGVPTDDQLTQHCNLGHASACSRLPQERDADAVRFSLGRERDGTVPVRYVTLKAQLPARAGVLEYHLGKDHWLVRHPDERLQAQAQAFLRARRPTLDAGR